MIRVGIIGLGRMGLSHFAIANSRNDVEVVGVCDTSSFVRGIFEKNTDVSCYKDMEDMLEKTEMDAVFITTPTRFHYEATKMSLERGLHVFVEKPFCLNPEEGQELSKLAGNKGLINQVGYHNRFIGTFREAKRLVESGELGEVYHTFGEVYGPVVLKETKKTWRSNPSEGGGCLYDYATHLINLVQFINGVPEVVSGSVLQKIYSNDVEDAVYSTLKYPNGALGQIRANWSDETYRKFSIQLVISCKKGKIRVDSQELHVFFRNNPIGNSYEKGWNVRYLTDLSPEIGFYLRGEEYSAQIDYFFNRIQGNDTQNVNSFQEATRTDNLVSMIKRDANTNG